MMSLGLIYLLVDMLLVDMLLVDMVLFDMLLVDDVAGFNSAIYWSIMSLGLILFTGR